MHLLNWKANSIKLDCSTFEKNSGMALLSIISANWPKIVSTYSFQAPSSQNHASVKLAQACCKLKFFLRAYPKFLSLAVCQMGAR